jgi:hypothetical protein
MTDTVASLRGDLAAIAGAIDPNLRAQVAEFDARVERHGLLLARLLDQPGGDTCSGPSADGRCPEVAVAADGCRERSRHVHASTTVLGRFAGRCNHRRAGRAPAMVQAGLTATGVD